MKEPSCTETDRRFAQSPPGRTVASHLVRTPSDRNLQKMLRTTRCTTALLLHAAAARLGERLRESLVVHGVEYAYGAHDFPSSGVFEVEPRQCPGFKFRQSIFIGTTNLDSKQVREFMEQQACNYTGDSYHLIIKNCNHFCKDMCYKLTGKNIPKWVNRLAKIGSRCNCILPEALKVATVEKDGNVVIQESEKIHLRNNFGSISSISTRQRHISMSSLFIRSPLKSCWSSCEPKQS